MQGTHNIIHLFITLVKPQAAPLLTECAACDIISPFVKKEMRHQLRLRWGEAYLLIIKKALQTVGIRSVLYIKLRLIQSVLSFFQISQVRGGS